MISTIFVIGSSLTNRLLTSDFLASGFLASGLLTNGLPTCGLLIHARNSRSTQERLKVRARFRSHHAKMRFADKWFADKRFANRRFAKTSGLLKKTNDFANKRSANQQMVCEKEDEQEEKAQS